VIKGKSWQHRLKKTFSIIAAAALIAILLVTGAVAYNIRHSWPQESGTISVSGTSEPVEILRDSWGVPHIYASTSHDLFFAQGYTHAQDRFWQMDFWRHIGSGRLAELFGPSQLDTDRFLRTLGWARVAQQELEQLDPDLDAALHAYAAGVNAYLAEHQGSALSLEYAILKLLNPSYKPEPWKPLHTLTWAKAMAWDLGGNMSKEIERTLLLKTLTPEQIAALFPPYPVDRPVVVSQTEQNELPSATNNQPSATQPSAAWLSRRLNSGVSASQDIALADLDPSSSQVSLLDFLSDRLQSLHQPLEALQTLLGPQGSAIGSNGWVISGDRTVTGKPMLANDPHLAVQMPSIWYELGLHCKSKGEDCPYDVTGFSFAGMVGVILGHNDRLAWGLTNIDPDVMDLYVEKINPQNPNQYEVNGQWVDMKLVPETLQVAGGKPVTQTVRYTRHGPIISDTYPDIDGFSEQSRLPLPQPYAIALRWTALEPSTLTAGVLKLNRARNWEEFRSAVKDFDVPAQNAIYADVEGNIGYQMPGKIPIRPGNNGRYPVPGWTDEFEWQGYVDFEQLPSLFNPHQGYIATANNAVVRPAQSDWITPDWDYGNRAQRLTDLLDRNDRLFSLTDMERIQGDNYNLNADTLVPILLQIPLADDHLKSVRNLLKDWNRQELMDSAAAALFEVFWQQLLAATFHDDLPRDFWPNGSDRWCEVARNLVRQPNSIWWDDRTTPIVENRDKMFHHAFANAVTFLEETLGKDPGHWHWGDLHTLTFRNLTLGKSGNAAIESLFNRGPFAASGGSAIVNATSWDARQSFDVTWIPSMRMIVDLANLERSRTIHAPGQSGHAFHPHYDDLVDSWRAIVYHPMIWGRRMIEQKATTNLVLKPSDKD